MSIAFRSSPTKVDRSACRVAGRRVSHCQIVRTIQPVAIRAAVFSASRSRFRCSLGSQNSGRDLGGFPILQPCQCQKHPWTNIAFFDPGNTISGVPGRSLRCSRNRLPIAWRALRTMISGEVFFERIRAIKALRLDGVRLSVTGFPTLGLEIRLGPSAKRGACNRYVIG